MRAAYLASVDAVRGLRASPFDVSSLVRLSRSPDDYQAGRGERRELAYEALLAAGRTTWRVGERIRCYRTRGGGGALVDLDRAALDPRRDYDVEHYLRVLRDTFAARLARAFAPADFAAVFADPDQLELFAPALDAIQPVLTAVAPDPADP